MGFIVCSILAALLFSRLAGGRLSAFERVPAHGLMLPVTALAVLVLGVVLGWVGLPAGGLFAVSLGVSALLVGCFTLVNRALAGTGLIAAGLLLNAIVVGLNGAMPVSAYALARAGVGAAVVAGDDRHEPATSHTRLRLLGDVVPVPLPLWPEVDSVGDLLAAAGLAQLVVMAMRPYGRRETRAESAKAGSKVLASSD